MKDDARIRIDVPLGTTFVEIEDEVIRQTIALCGGLYHRASRRLDVGPGRIRRTMKRLGMTVPESRIRNPKGRYGNNLARSENEAATGTGDGGAAIPSFPGGQGSSDE
jgi:hypothetical protein